MKRYLAFYGAFYYPSRGMGDFIGDFDNIEDAIECIKLKNEEHDGGSFEYCWANVYDTETRKIIWNN